MHCAQFSHSPPRPALRPRDSRPPWPRSLCIGIGSHGSCFLLVSLLIGLPIRTYVTMRFAPHVCIPPHLPTTTVPTCFPHSMPVPFVQPLTSIAHIRLVKHVCFASSYIDFDLLSLLLALDLSLPCYSISSVLCKLLDPQSASLLTCVPGRLFLWYLQLCDFPMIFGEAHIPTFNSKYLDCNRRPAQCTS